MTKKHQIAWLKENSQSGVVLQKMEDSIGNQVLSIRLESTGETKSFGHDEVILLGDMHFTA